MPKKALSMLVLFTLAVEVECKCFRLSLAPPLLPAKVVRLPIWVEGKIFCLFYFVFIWAYRPASSCMSHMEAHIETPWENSFQCLGLKGVGMHTSDLLPVLVGLECAKILRKGKQNLSLLGQT